jgi:dsDNA-binding SOS-regulon protein
MELRQVFTTEDGKVFETKADALNYLRRPKIKAAMMTVTGDNDELSDWLVENQEVVEAAFEAGTIRRVSKSDSTKLTKALEAIVEAANPKFAFVADNIEAIISSFRWPSVKRLSEEEKAAEGKAALVAASENEELADWVIENRQAVLEAYSAGVEKRQVNPKAAEALAAYRAKKAAEKAAAEAA